jgi:hypothetical protein
MVVDNGTALRSLCWILKSSKVDNLLAGGYINSSILSEAEDVKTERYCVKLVV